MGVNGGRFIELVSIHAPVMDAKPPFGLFSARLCGFNPRARDGREDMSKFPKEIDIVSIHAPVMDANGYFHNQIISAGFNPRARDGRELPLFG